MIVVNERTVVTVSPGNVPVVFLHAFPMNAAMWEPQMRYLQQQGRSYLAVNYPGFGGSKELSGTPNIARYAARVEEVLYEMQIHKAILVGLSMGGYVALAFFRQAPERVAGLLLANTRASADSEEGRANRFAMIELLKRNPDTSDIVSSFLEKFFTAAAREAHSAFVKKAEEIMRQATAGAIIQAQQAMATRPDSFDLLPRMHFPVVVVAADQDTLTPVADAEKMVANLPQGELVVIQNAAHLSNLEQEDDFNRALQRLLERVKA